MRSIILFILSLFFTCFSDTRMVAKHSVTLQDPTDHLINNVLEHLVGLAFARFLHRTELENITLAKSEGILPRIPGIGLQPQFITGPMRALPSSRSTNVLSGRLQRLAGGLCAICPPSEAEAVRRSDAHVADREGEFETAYGFAQLVPSVPSSVIAALALRGVHSPTPIQAAAMQSIYNGDNVMLAAETGSGKTLAFILPILARLGLAGATHAAPTRRVIVIAPSRELAVQLASDTAFVLPAPGAVRILTAGAKPADSEILEATVLICTPSELLKELDDADEDNAVGHVVDDLAVLVMDEVDMLLPPAPFKTYKPRSDRVRKRDAKQIRTKGVSANPTEELVFKITARCQTPDLQVISASATASRAARQELTRVLNRDSLGRFKSAEDRPQIVRPNEVMQADLSTLPRTIVIPEGVRHYYLRVAKYVKLRRRINIVAKPKSTKRLTVKQKRDAKTRAKKEAWKRNRGMPKKSEIHPLFTTLYMAINKTRPTSALVFLCRSTGLTVRRAARDMRKLGLIATPLHEAIGLERVPSMLQNRTSELSTASAATLNSPNRFNQTVDSNVELLTRHRAVSETFSARQGRSALAGLSEDSPLIVTFEDMARGLHFDAVDTVFIVGMPDSSDTYLHLAGRTGRYPVLEGSVVTICVKDAHEVLYSWSQSMGGIQFEEIEPDNAYGSEEQATYIFKHGEVAGFKLSEDGTVLEVNGGGQADLNGVKEGDRILKVGDAAYSRDALKSLKEGSSNYTITFQVGEAELAEDELRAEEASFDEDDDDDTLLNADDARGEGETLKDLRDTQGEDDSLQNEDGTSGDDYYDALVSDS